jgi:hypothetical protein
MSNNRCEITRSEVMSFKASLLAERNRLDKLISAVEEYVDAPEPYQGGDPHPNPVPARKVKGTAVIHSVIDILKSRGPLETPQILEALTVSGTKVRGKRPIQTLYGILYKDARSKTKRVMRSQDGKWKLWQNE